MGMTSSSMTMEEKREKHALLEDHATNIGSVLERLFLEAQGHRRFIEERLLQDLRAYRGVYDPEVLARMQKNQSRIFSRMTRKKVRTVDARIMEMLFPASKEKNWSISPTPEPRVTTEAKQNIIEYITQSIGRAPTEDEVRMVVKQEAKKAAESMSLKIEDQLAEVKYRDIIGDVVHSGNLYGTGILKGPLVEKRSREAWVLSNSGEWELGKEELLLPFLEFVPIWDFFPDMAAKSIDDCNYVFQRHVHTSSQLMKLTDRPYFKEDAILDYMRAFPDGDLQYLPHEIELNALGNKEAISPSAAKRYELKEYWGVIQAGDLADCGCDLPEGADKDLDMWGNIWMLGPIVIKAVIVPLKGRKLPFYIYYYDKDETNIFGEGVASIIRDEQVGINSSTRAMLDNAAISAGPQLEVNMSLLAKGEDASSVYPRRIWHRTGLGVDSASPALRVYNIPSYTREYMQIKDMFENQAHESTVPSYMQGDAPGGRVGNTVGGLSMLMGAANINIKEQVRFYDEGITKPFIKAMYNWNMQFTDDPAIKGDYEVSAKGSSSLVAKEIRAQQLDSFATSTLNPYDAPYINRGALLMERAKAYDLGADDVVKTEKEVREEVGGQNQVDGGIPSDQQGQQGQAQPEAGMQ